jgi:hypothetical protein
MQRDILLLEEMAEAADQAHSWCKASRSKSCQQIVSDGTP